MAFDLTGISDPVTFFKFPNTVMNSNLGAYGAWTGVLFMVLLASFIGLKMYTTVKAFMSAAFVALVVSFGMANAGLIAPITPMAFIVCLAVGYFVE